MYAVIRTGGKQERVAEGQVVQVERLHRSVGDEVSFTPVLLVDDSDVVSASDELQRASVTGRIVSETKGPKVTGFTYKNKTNQRRRWGHRQGYDVVEITGITRG